MSLRALLPLLSLAPFALAVGTPGYPGYVDRPTSKPNANPQNTSEPRLNGKIFPITNLPFQVDTSAPQPNVNYRGPQAGYNQCNSTTEGPNSMCQTAVLNSINDFCFFAPSKPDSLIADTEGIEVAWCTQPGHGTRVVPPGTFSAIQFIQAPSYVEITATLNQGLVNLKPGDSGGELDSGGQDERGNPIGGVFYSTSLRSSKGGSYTQSRAWHTFIGGNTLCMKLCDPNAPDANGICEHTYDTLGCNFNIPAAYAPDVFLSCQSADQGPVGVYVVNGEATKWPSPGETGIPDPPYTPTIPSSSMCTTYKSADLFGAGASIIGGSSNTQSIPTTTSTSTATTPTSKAGGSPSSSSGSGSVTAAGPTGTAGTGAAAPRTGMSGGMGALVAVAAVLLGAVVLA